MVLAGGMAASDQPWNRINLPPRRANALKLVSVAFRTGPIFANRIGGSRSKLKSETCQPGSPVTRSRMVPNTKAAWVATPGLTPKIQPSHPRPGTLPVSPPGVNPTDNGEPLEVRAPP